LHDGGTLFFLFSHDEVVHFEGIATNKMAGDRWQKVAPARPLRLYVGPSRKENFLFMGDELGQWREWNFEQAWTGICLEEADSPRFLNDLVRDLNVIYKSEPALWEADNEPAGFQWIDADNADENMLLSFANHLPLDAGILAFATSLQSPGSPIPGGAQSWRVPADHEYRCITI